MHMFFVEPRQIRDGQVTITGPDVNHIRNVLRMKPGEIVRVSDEKDFCGQCRVEELLEDQILLTVLEEADSTELPAQVTLFQGPRVTRWSGSSRRIRSWASPVSCQWL